jgi:hypothetical protein
LAHRVLPHRFHLPPQPLLPTLPSHARKPHLTNKPPPRISLQLR